MNEYCYNADIKMHEFERTLKHDNIEMLILSVKYPIINMDYNPCGERIINSQISMNVHEYIQYSKYLYDQAVQSYMNSQANNYPFHAYTAYFESNITYNENCHLSIFTDKYEFTGGAHGSTTRSSDNWNLCTGTHLSLNNFFDPNINYRQLITDEILNQAEHNIKQNPGIYFEDYKSLIIKNFNPHSFYLTPHGITFYYQQYDIAPYSTGIVEFTIPYNKLNWHPKC